MKGFLPLLLFVVFSHQGFSQSPAVEQRMTKRFTPEQIQDMRTNDPARYNSTLWWIANSWEVVENGVSRKPTEKEVSAVDIFELDKNRTHQQTVVVNDPATGLQVKLFCLNELWPLLQSALSPADYNTLRGRWEESQASTNKSKN